jgi:hypothetical protein
VTLNETRNSFLLSVIRPQHNSAFKSLVARSKHMGNPRFARVVPPTSSIAADDATAYMNGPEFSADVAGVSFDPEKMLATRKGSALTS